MTVVNRPMASPGLLELRDIDPYPGYERIRAAGPVVWDASMRAWLVLSHDGCAFVERREDLFAEPTGSLPGAAEIIGRRDLRSLVGEPHEALHRALAHAWRPDAIGRLRTAIRPIIADHLATLAGRERLEVFDDVARLLPISVVGRVLGLPVDDLQTLDRVKGWMDAVLAWRHSYGADPEIRAAAAAARRQLEPALLETVRDRRDRPRDDAITFLWEAGREVATDWGETDVLDNARFIFEAGSETTASLICGTVHRLLVDGPADRARVLAEPAAFARYLEEVLRHSTVIHLRARTATADVPLGGVVIARGERVIAVNAAANRDPQRWERPDAFDPTRPRLWGHLAFNVGPRHCVGAHLARMEATETILGLWRAFPDLEQVPGPPAPAPVGFVSRTWRPLAVAHEPTTPARALARVMDGAGWSGSTTASANGSATGTARTAAGAARHDA
jgi:cytochrome P450